MTAPLPAASPRSGREGATPASGADSGAIPPAPRRPGVLRRLARDRVAVVSAAFLVFCALLCACAPWFFPENFYAAQDRQLGAVPPGAAHWLGTDALGRDLLARLLEGGRVSLTAGLVGTLVSVLIGTTYGIVAGWRGGRAGTVMMQGVDVLAALPFTLFVILLTLFLGRELIWIYAAIGAVSWLSMARIVRNETRLLKTRPFIEAAQCLGQRPARVICRHLLPNLGGVVAIYATLTVPNVMLAEAFISFLGLGIKAPMTSWGLLIKEGADAMEECPWLLVAPVAAFSSTLLALNLFGDALRDALDPRAA